MLWYIYWGACSLIYGVFEYSDMIWISPPEDIEQGPKDTLCSPVIPDPFVPHNMCFVMISNFPWVKPLTAMLCRSQERPSTFTSSLGCRMHLHVISFPPPSTWINPSTLYLKLILVFNDVIAATKQDPTIKSPRPGQEGKNEGVVTIPAGIPPGPSTAWTKSVLGFGWHVLLVKPLFYVAPKILKHQLQLYIFLLLSGKWLQNLFPGKFRRGNDLGNFSCAAAAALGSPL